MMKIAVAVLLLSTVCLSLVTFSVSQQAANNGQWKLLTRNLGISAMHVQLLPNDKIIAYDRTDAGPSNISLPSGKCVNFTTGIDCTAHSVELTISHRTIRPLTVTTDTWCSSGALSSNGTLIQTGGFTRGDRAVRYLSPCANCDWVEDLQGLALRRWYATNHILPDGRVIVVGGRWQPNYEFIPKSSVWEQTNAYDLPFLRETNDPSENNLYPFVHSSTDGNLFMFANTKAILFDYVNNKVVRSYPELPGGISRNYPSSGSSVLLPIVLNSNDTIVRAEVMVCGGADSSSYSSATNGVFLPASDTCGRLVITDPSPQWEIEHMPFPRVMGDMVMLPTGQVLIINGASKGTAGWGLAREPVLTPVLYKTSIVVNESRGFDVMNPSSIPRVYHSTAHLLSDGRVLIGGSNTQFQYQFTGVLFPTELRVETFFPPYLLSPNRLQITMLSSSNLGYGVKFSVGCAIVGLTSDVLSEGVSVTVVSPSFTTHSFSMNQRLLVLEAEGLSLVRSGRYSVSVTAPGSANLAPPGYYMLFVVHKGVPSPGKWIHIG